VINLAHVSEMAARDNERVAGMKLSKIDKGHGQLILEYDAGGNLTTDNIAKNATFCIRVTHRPNENKISYGHWGCGQSAEKVSRSSREISKPYDSGH
jgi:hypothetical protein